MIRIQKLILAPLKQQMAKTTTVMKKLMKACPAQTGLKLSTECSNDFKTAEVKRLASVKTKRASGLSPDALLV